VGAGGEGWVFDGVTSGWSKTQTIIINKNSNETPNQQSNNSETSSNPNQPTGFSWIELSIITTIAVIMAVVATMFILKKTVNTKTFNTTNKLWM
jgi:cell division protein FtsL